jgi:peptidoglycan glycosyltransferase
MAIGQSLLRVSALQMALVAARWPTGGELMRPHVVDRLVDRDGRTNRRDRAERQVRVMSGATAG